MLQAILQSYFKVWEPFRAYLAATCRLYNLIM